MAKKAGPSADEHTMRCSFCNKSQFEIRRLVAGPLATICDECVRDCAEIVGEERPSGDVEAPAERIGWPGGVYCSLCHSELADDAILVEHRGLVCMACATGVQRALARLQKAKR